ncbi:unnamed protein product [Thelazia callipaeda]|uniref:Centromere protein Q n=1 Tax=Thelazia callipaeda TaxID=103827 RepID=A0A158RAW4_THECL|nr:unnamed protein product [Thelazia callipaeda]
MSMKSHEMLKSLRPSLKHHASQNRDSDIQRHVTFATPNLPSEDKKCKEQAISHQKNAFKRERPKQENDAQRKLAPLVQTEEVCSKKSKRNDQILRLCQAQKVLVKSDFVIKRLEKETADQEKASALLLQDAVSLIEADVSRSCEEHKIEQLLSDGERQQRRASQKLHEELMEFDNIVESLKKTLIAMKNSNDILDKQMASPEGEEEDSSFASQVKSLSMDLKMYLEVLDSLKQLHF